MNNVIRMNYGIKGEKRAILRDLMGNPVLDTGWSDNVITNTGLTNMLDATNWGNYWCVGSDGTAASVNDNSIGSLLKWMSQTTGVTNVRTNSGSPNYIVSHTDSRRWEAGTGGVVREFTLGLNTTGGGAGVRTTVTPEINKGPDQILDFYYRMTATPDLIDRTGTITVTDAINGNKNYNYTLRVTEVDQIWNIINGTWRENGSYLAHIAYDGIIGDITGGPAGNSDLSDTQNPPFKISTVPDYANNRATRTYRITFGVDDANWATGIRSVESRLQSMSGVGTGAQVQFDDPLNPGQGIIKTSNDKITFDFSITVTRL